MVDGILICLPSLLRLVIGPLEYDMTTCAREYGSRMNPLSSKKPQWCNPGIFAPAAFRGTVEGKRRDEDAGQPHETVCHCQGYRTRDLTYDTLVSPPLSFGRPRQSLHMQLRRTLGRDGDGKHWVLVRLPSERLGPLRFPPAAFTS